MNNKKILMDISWSNMGGIGRFTDEISKLLTGISCAKIYKKCASPFAPLGLAVNILFQGKVDLILLPGYIPPLFCSKKFIVTIHDLNHLDLNDNSSFFKKLFYKFIIKRGCHQAYKIFTVSNFSKERIAKWSGVEPDKIVTVYNGVSDEFNIDVQPMDLGYEYLLCVGNRKTHKNESRILSAFSKAEIDPSIKLVFSGNPSSDLEKLIVQYGISDRVNFLGFVSESNLPSLYKGSLGLVFPSLYEGFGLPVVEAMACGVPVLTSTTSSLPEVAGEAAILVDPVSVCAISDGITKLVNDTKLREHLVHEGLLRAKKFSWKNVVNEIEMVLTEACNETK
ncbi:MULTISPECIES: glycosyltransferase family 4 protein [Citrobacter]|uniref:Glycosyl transferase n=3 Tax=Citrobacter freundii complex TaxID=1344959 RepID=A0A2Z4BXF0_9ENTR|nr:MULTISPECIES: glycosyltransferase family 1 protein [Citrobacter]MBS6073711.1 glycosyltransferase family 4 protein [Citrobacter freundii]AWU66742.1 glycosyl transferase [Citrobacter werkmanii]MBC2619948.1 glycosyltransferase family 4 protein [Citrobacter cronae]MBY6247927.1 glycosyltransferase family 4 protein [Citrobacter werkmanii]MBY6252226.1 glycosyltransferase family 4 protein [Citrobacter werkmanii]